MLVIRRRAGESVLVGDSVEIEILDLSGGQVKLGIRAPREVPILRKEVHLTGEQNRRASAGITSEQWRQLQKQFEDSLKHMAPDR
ncbi:MAG: carbon storage regulator [Bryobacteraceae bacterium]